MTEKELIAVEDLALSLANKKPHWQSEDGVVKVRRPYRHYFVLDEVDASLLEQLRKIIPIIIEERRKLSS